MPVACHTACTGTVMNTTANTVQKGLGYICKRYAASPYNVPRGHARDAKESVLDIHVLAVDVHSISIGHQCCHWDISRCSSFSREYKHTKCPRSLSKFREAPEIAMHHFPTFVFIFKKLTNFQSASGLMSAITDA